MNKRRIIDMENNYRKETICIQSGWKPKKGEPRVLQIGRAHV